MKLTWILLAVLALASAAVIPEQEYLPPAEDVKNAVEVVETEPTEAPEESAALADDGYRYKTVRRLKYRKRRDVSELVAPEYLPPAEEAVEAEPTEAPEESAALAEDGYRYKTVRRLKYRKRRDVSELVAPEYLPPAEEAVEAEPTEAPEESAALAEDGYRYKTVRRLKYRKSRDVSELVAPEYLPPAEEAVEAEPTEAPEESAALAEDGYRYKTVRRLKYRKRRDVSELVAPEYLPPAEEAVEAEPTEAPEESAALAEDGYRYKTVRRLKYRKRRDVSELVAPEYLPPAEEAVEAEPTEAPEESAALAEDGYRYKTVRRLKYRKRRDVSELVAPEYLPPAEEAVEAEPTEAPEESAALADDGYRYKTVRRLKYRKRRDVSELIAPEYLPPAEEAIEAEPTEAPEESAALADDGYRYKTVRRLKYRKRRDISELVAPEYLPPAEEAVEAEPTEAPEESAALAEDGYRYKTVRRLKYRKRRDVSELVAPEYLPPAEEAVEAEPTEAPEESAALAEDGYRYKTVRRLKYRKRRDVSELVAPEYLPPAEEAVEAEPTEAPEESAALAEDGYRYKTVRRLKYRKRRDVSELVAPEYLPPAEEAVEAEPTEAPEESAALAEDGYRYKTVRRLKYRKRRDVSELVAPEYLPPAEEAVEAEPTEAPEESAALAEDGYRYKTVRRLKYRKRRDVSELVAPEYLPPAEEAVEAEPTEAPEESAALAEDGYRYKTVRRLKYRKRRDVSELVAPEYLPPAEEAVEAEPTEAPEESAALADDGYRYKTVRRLKYRKRRDVSEHVAPEYLPPAEEAVEAEPTEAPEESAALAEDGYRYKTVRRLKYRKRRDVSELVAPEYLPPVEEAVETEPTEAPEESAALADDGYRYKTVRRLKYRKRRDVSELVAPEYLPPAEEAVEAEPTEAPEESAALADDGYRYKTVRRLKYRKRRDVSELVAPEYLPPAEESVEAEPTEAPEESAALAEDGYRYKTVRRLKYRKRRDVSELVAPEYLPPAEEAVEAEPTEAPEESAALAEDGYRYKTVRRLKYRKRRDVSELVAPEYLPPAEEVVEAEPTEAPEESAALAGDGYRYKTVRRLKYRKRRDVSELVAPEYLPPTGEATETEPTEALKEAAILSDDGYRYRTIKRLKYRN